MRTFTLDRKRKYHKPGKPEAEAPREPIILEAQGHLFKLKIPQGRVVAANSGRGEVTGFSASSRKRMLEKVARLDERAAGFICFVTVTYPDGEGPPNGVKTERDRRAFLKRFKRAYPACACIWRRQWERRKSGEFAGMLFPHYHFLMFNLPFVPCDIVNQMWREVLGQEAYVRTEIKAVRSWKQTIYYAGTYMASVEERGGGEAPDAREGAPEGKSSRASGGAASCSLVNRAYLAEKRKVSIGRSWGLFNARRMPFAEREVNHLEPGPWVEEARTLAKKQWAGVPDDPDYGFTLFTEMAEDWMFRICALQEDKELGPVSKEELSAVPF